ncbi:MAG: hypothetical protein IPK82_12375 [Polyangiaceae bacterium]|nr:hypothetical protein [Polyangiaceae bacterium]
MSRTSVARKLDEAPVAKPTAFEFLERGMQRVDVEALLKAGEHYGDNTDRELADLDSGKHPLQVRTQRP